MLDTIRFAFNAIAPILLMIALGYYLRRIGLLNENFLQVGNKLVFRLGLPILLFYNIYQVESLAQIRWDLALMTVVVICLVFAAALAAVKLWVPNDRQKGVVVQCIFRSNFAIIGLPLATSLGGASGTAAASFLSAFAIPVFNTLAVIALSLYTGKGKPTPKKILHDVVRNPLIQAVAAGLVVVGVRALLPVNEQGLPVFQLSTALPFLYEVVEDLSRLASPLALLVLGGQFDFKAIGGMRSQLAIGVVGRTVFCPVVGLCAAILLETLGVMDLGAGEYAALTALFGSPVAVSSAIMAAEMGNDEQLAGQLVVWTSVVSMATLFLIIFALRSLGLV